MRTPKSITFENTKVGFRVKPQISGLGFSPKVGLRAVSNFKLRVRPEIRSLRFKAGQGSNG